MAEDAASRIEYFTLPWLWYCWHEEIYLFKAYQGTFGLRSCHTASIVRRARDDTREKAEQSSRGQCSRRLALLSPFAQASVHAGRQGCAEVCRSGAGLEATGSLPSPNPGSHLAIVFCSFYCAHQHFFRGPHIEYWAMPTGQREEM